MLNYNLLYHSNAKLPWIITVILNSKLLYYSNAELPNIAYLVSTTERLLLAGCRGFSPRDLFATAVCRTSSNLYFLSRGNGPLGLGRHTGSSSSCDRSPRTRVIGLRVSRVRWYLFDEVIAIFLRLSTAAAPCCQSQGLNSLRCRLLLSASLSRALCTSRRL